jgi:hypothetical protein
MNHKNPRTSAQIFVPKPTTLPALSKDPRGSNEELREAMHVDNEQFGYLTVGAGNIFIVFYLSRLPNLETAPKSGS